MGYVQALPSGTGTLGASSNLNVFYPGQTVANLVTVPLGAHGAVTLYDVAGGHPIVDVAGYFGHVASSTDGRYVALGPTRILDSRDRTGLTPTGGAPAKPSAGQALPVQLTSNAGVPGSGVSSVVLTVTATQSSGAGFVQAIATGSGAALGATSNLNLTSAGQTVANLVIVPVGVDGTAQIYTSSGAHLVADVVGYFTDASAVSSDAGLFVPVLPRRLMDTRSGGAPTAGSQMVLTPLGAAGVPLTGVSAVLVNATATQTAGPGYLHLFPTGQGTAGASSSVNFTGADQTVASAAITGIGTGGTATVYSPVSSHVVVDVSGYFTGPVNLAGSVAYIWGRNLRGQLGDGTTTDRSPPILVAPGTRWRSMAAGVEHTVAVRTDGTLWTWGMNEMGQLGNGAMSLEPGPTPARVGNDTRWSVAAAGSRFSLAIKTDGTLWAWGINGLGQLGDGSTTERWVPTEIAAGARWTAVAVGGVEYVVGGNAHAVAVRSDGTLWTWGSNSSGQLGDDSIVNHSAQQQVGQDNHWATASAGLAFTVAIKTDGTMWAWGENDFAQLGNGSIYNPIAPPAQVGQDGDWTQVSAGPAFALALKSDGTLWSWGCNSHGELGRGPSRYAYGPYEPTRVGTRTDWALIAAGYDHALAFRTEGLP